MDIRYIGHSCFQLTAGDKRILIDPFLTGNPKATVAAAEVDPTHIFLTHGHADHFGDVTEIARRTGAEVVCIVEIGGEIEAAGIENVIAPNIGGTYRFDGGWVRLVPAWHTSTTPGGTVNTPTGLVICLDGTIVYHLGDTALFSDLRLVGERDRIDIALVCMGGFYTMDAIDAAQAVRLIKPKVAIPCHYGTFPILAEDANEFKQLVTTETNSDAVILAPGETYSYQPSQS